MEQGKPCANAASPPQDSLFCLGVGDLAKAVGATGPEGIERGMWLDKRESCRSLVPKHWVGTHLRATEIIL